ncbi:unnamed protein product [Brassicogethes aeneus]|uniref:Lipase domain-containing protein n=1 Tax=Brassicogethes aeneus TaxID=1431903 RepID=A0A9P0B511_BRAAE|nr:unnamed protein product [Brassicogethes aeneus]
MWPLIKLNVESSRDLGNKKMIYQCRGLPFVRTERLPKYMYLIVPKHRDDGRALLEDIKDLSLPDLVKLVQDTTQRRPNDVHESDVSFYLYTKNLSGIKVNYTLTEVLNTSKPFKFIIHGYIENHKRLWYKNMTTEYLINGDFNIIQVDWERPSRFSYISSAFNTRYVVLFILVKKMECASSTSSDEWECELEECAVAIIINKKQNFFNVDCTGTHMNALFQ